MDKRLIYMKRLGKTFIVFCLFVQLYVFARIYLFASCIIPTYSMAPTLLGGDYIVAFLQIPGRRIWEEDPMGNLIIHREKGLREVHRNDVVVFNFPYSKQTDKMVLDMNLFYCKRCVAIPGDSYEWNRKGKKVRIYLPMNGDELLIDSTNYANYYKCIEYETNEKLRRFKDDIYLGDSVIHKYCFLHNYYFMCGDNARDSYDSRFWGILPDDFILGVGQFIWFSTDDISRNIRWKRLFKKL